MGKAFDEYLEGLLSKIYITPLTEADISEHWFWLISTSSDYDVNVVDTMKMRYLFIKAFS